MVPARNELRTVSVTKPVSVTQPLPRGLKGPIVLTGMMLSGKSTVGRTLAHQLSWAFADLDEVIARVAGKGIPKIFAEDGEAGFRSIERAAFREWVSNHAADGYTVLAAGGGTLEAEPSLRLATRHCFVVYLRARVETLTERYQPGSGRPLLDDATSASSALQSLLERRTDTYESSHLVIEVDGLTIEQVVERIIQGYAAHNSG